MVRNNIFISSNIGLSGSECFAHLCIFCQSLPQGLHPFLVCFYMNHTSCCPKPSCRTSETLFLSLVKAAIENALNINQ